jgi:hypothetical protein
VVQPRVAGTCEAKLGCRAAHDQSGDSAARSATVEAFEEARRAGDLESERGADAWRATDFFDADDRIAGFFVSSVPDSGRCVERCVPRPRDK